MTSSGNDSRETSERLFRSPLVDIVESSRVSAVVAVGRL